MAVRKTKKGLALKRWFKEKKNLGQPAGKPRRVKNVKRRK